MVFLINNTLEYDPRKPMHHNHPSIAETIARLDSDINDQRKDIVSIYRVSTKSLELQNVQYFHHSLSKRAEFFFRSAVDRQKGLFITKQTIYEHKTSNFVYVYE